MSITPIKNKIISTRVTSDISERAKVNLAKQGLTISEYIRLSLIKAANNEVDLINFLDTSETLNAKKQAEEGRITSFNSVEAWWNDLNSKDSKNF